MYKETDKRTKLVATIGPSSDNYEMLKKLVQAGVTCVRANFSHGSYEEQKNKFNLAKQVSKELNLPLSLMLDTKGPEIRVGKMKDGVQLIKQGTMLDILTTEEAYKNLEGNSEQISVSYDMSLDLQVNDSVLLDDGKLSTKVVRVSKGLVQVYVQNNHKLKTNKRINLPGVDFSLPFLSPKDVEDVKFGVQNGISYVAASFVNSAENVKQLRKVLVENGGEHIEIISKIESTLGIKNIDQIIEASDGIMVARGDLGLEVPYYEVPYYQKMIIRKCREAGKPVIVATQMLDSMENSPHPTRAEVTDVYFAVELGADSTMLSGESANGGFPLEAVQTMTKISKRAEREFYSKIYYPVHLEKIKEKLGSDLRSLIAYEIAKKTQGNEYKFAIVLSRTGKLLKKVANYRPNTTIVGILDDEKLTNSFGIYSSVFTSLDSKELFSEIKKDHSKAILALKPFEYSKGDKFLVVENDSIKEYTVQ
ncbi:pyruvate kinase [Mycoplasmopsis synoviae]|uniref:Pyruvate kinase n=1 Tax=Mycoplasmopsis synoviae TaxID=2109 RepID=A0A3B0PJE6_MYCSY|nr:pyruvate kinase [Mycoplasmopsis synoviae]AKB11365.1 pyruvate kinase [Mycoplasmopsis synoviae ATCC 25204]UBX97590.1 pyruvate kinase [Mycoplasmopsis synoviae]UBX98275.1 pyruvate kinase [Mycoplasmopsis synoviae]UBX99625.1 pyruvate kinase [Mycoplasmopsis synoviae]UBX99968.1 pyruvate kinase [Mycoplasmopsis synoviae]